MECCVIEYGSLGRVRDGQLDMSRYLYYLYPIDILFHEESVPPNNPNPDIFSSVTTGNIRLISAIPRDCTPDPDVANASAPLSLI